jgi:hypothetical protein
MSIATYSICDSMAIATCSKCDSMAIATCSKCDSMAIAACSKCDSMSIATCSKCDSMSIATCSKCDSMAIAVCNKCVFKMDNEYNRHNNFIQDQRCICSSVPNIILANLNAELNPICHLLTLLGAHHILHISRVRVNVML